jgi:hypothetical protein
MTPSGIEPRPSGWYCSASNTSATSCPILTL